MKRKLFACRLTLLVLVLSLFAGVRAHAQCDPHNPNPPSPPAQASVSLGGSDVTIYYCAPSMRGRKIFGSLLPYDKWWRTGANSATTIKTSTGLMIGSLMVPAGTYTLYSIPSETTWKLIVNKQTGQWGTVYKPEMDLGRTDMMKGEAPSSPVETFKISFEKTEGKKTQLHLIWENTDVYVPVEVM
ncbi:DUF2911 domain-containing protein [Silvibacterium dinghuense]|uniref:DUF2911 domain-containing protein n=1 Tax=Silvibacterium dinghuense TaxID=1560006 RepID=A0A4Q1S8R6_9BACT|nr:DUF2911 domain-containing protein [Silvibacterium dinghuense]RXS93390.1 DUF2911 domain-containing protein [Silvibacterium dinghuense]GGH05427.1 hypothetical protein GCM10011586_21970 [Silvibacterium dinghuense]